MIRPPSYWHRLGDATSQWFNVAWFNGNANESISGRAYRKAWLRAEDLIDRVLGKGHCDESYIADLARSIDFQRKATPADIARALVMLDTPGSGK